MPQLQLWRGRAEIRLESRDFKAAGDLIGKLQDKLQLSGISFGIAPETRRKLEDDLTAEAIATFRAKADAVSLAWKAKGYKLVQLSLGTNGGGMPHPVMMRSAKMMDAEAVAAPVLAGGESRIAVNVSGSIELQP